MWASIDSGIIMIKWASNRIWQETKVQYPISFLEGLLVSIDQSYYPDFFPFPFTCNKCFWVFHSYIFVQIIYLPDSISIMTIWLFVSSWTNSNICCWLWRASVAVIPDIQISVHVDSLHHTAMEVSCILLWDQVMLRFIC